MANIQSASPNNDLLQSIILSKEFKELVFTNRPPTTDEEITAALLDNNNDSVMSLLPVLRAEVIALNSALETNLNQVKSYDSRIKQTEKKLTEEFAARFTVNGAVAPFTREYIHNILTQFSGMSLPPSGTTVNNLNTQVAQAVTDLANLVGNSSLQRDLERFKQEKFNIDNGTGSLGRRRAAMRRLYLLLLGQANGVFIIKDDPTLNDPDIISDEDLALLMLHFDTARFQNTLMPDSEQKLLFGRFLSDG